MQALYCVVSRSSNRIFGQSDLATKKVNYYMRQINIYLTENLNFVIYGTKIK